jgi:methyl-accepting chemotaxis protein
MKNWFRQLILVRSVESRYAIAFIFLSFLWGGAVIVLQSVPNIAWVEMEKVVFGLLFSSYVVAIAILGYNYAKALQAPLVQVTQGLQNIINGQEFRALNMPKEFDRTIEYMQKIQETLNFLVVSQQANIFERLGIKGITTEDDGSSKLMLILQEIVDGSMQSSVASLHELTNILDAILPHHQSAANNIDLLADTAHATKKISGIFSDYALQISDLIKFENTQQINCQQKVLQTTNTIEEVDFKLNNIVGASEKINTAALLMQEIVDQINLLALNAAIEASRISDSGKGFSVVAAEMKRFAKEANAAADEISDQAENMRQAVSHISSSITNVNSVVFELNAILAKISDNIQSQLTVSNSILESSEQINLNSEAMAQNILSIAATMQEVSSAYKNLNQVGQNIYENSQLTLTELKNLTNF